MRPRLALLLLLVAAALSTRLPSGGVLAQGSPTGRISFLHLSADAPALDIYVDGGRAILGLTFGETSEYLAVSPGGHKVQVTPSGRLDVLLSDTALVQAATSFTWVLAGLIVPADVSVNLTPELQFAHYLPLNDNAGAAADGKPRLRVVNASPGSGAFDVRADGPASVTLATSLAYGNVSAYAALAPGNFTMTINSAGSQTLIASIGPLALRAPNAYTLVLGGLLPGVMSASPPNSLQPFTSVQLTDQNSLRNAALTRGCNQVILNLPVGSLIINVLTRMENPGLLNSIWRFDNATKAMRVGYFSDPTAPLDYTSTVGSPEAAFICVSANTSWNPPS